jgi:hypothetical protein
MSRSRPFTAAFVFLMAVTCASAQSAGGLRIRIIDNGDKTPIVGASVTLSNTNKFVKTWTVLSDVEGEALFPVLRAGPGYVIQIIVDGYAGVRQDARVDIGVLKDVVIAMVPEHVERVTVVGEKTQVDLDQSEAATKFSSQFIQDLPVAGRFYQNVLALAPGVQDADGDGNPNVNGARERDFKAQVSGVSNVDPLTGLYLNQVASDSIEEITIIVAGAGAEYGRAQGGFAEIVQKQGSNDFEGVFGMIYSSSTLDGNGATNIPNSQLPDFYRYNPTLQVSGPIVKDRLWYRLSQEYLKREDPVVVGSGGTIATAGTERFTTADQLTWQVSSRNKLAFQFQADPLTRTNIGVGVFVPSSSAQKLEIGGPTYSVQWTAPYSPSLLANTIVAYQDTHLNILPMQTGVPNRCLPGTSLANAYCTDLQTGQVSGSSPVSARDRRQRVTVRGDVTYYKARLWGMSHQVKFGLIVENERYYRELLRQPDFLLQTLFNRRRGIYHLATTTASVDPFSTQRAVGSNWGVYGEDVLRPLSNLAITIGARIEQEHVASNGIRPFSPADEAARYIERIEGLGPNQRPVAVQQSFIAYEDILGSMQAIGGQLEGATLTASSYFQQQAFWTHFRQPDSIDITNNNVAPRLAVAWDPWNDGKTKISASAGRYYDKIFLLIPTREQTPVLAINTWDTDDLARGHLSFDPQFAFTVVDRNLKTPYQDEYSFAVEREIWEESSISLRYLHRNFKDQFQDVSINQLPNDYGRCSLQATPQQPYIVDSPGVGPVVDPFTGETYQDTDEGIGDGRLDDCTGQALRVPIIPGGLGDAGDEDEAPQANLQRPDGFADLYVLNPAWRDISRIGNYNAAKYDAVILELVRRQYKNWQMEASYTWSQAFGDGEDFELGLGDDRSTLQDEQGYQSYDRRHAVKVNATTVTPWGFRLGGAIQWQSGLPYSILLQDVSMVLTPPPYDDFYREYSGPRTVYPTHQRNDQRNRSYWNVDAKLVKEMNLTKGMNLQLTAEIFNLLNADTYAVYSRGADSGFVVNGQAFGFRRFGRQYQVGLRLAF